MFVLSTYGTFILDQESYFSGVYAPTFLKLEDPVQNRLAYMRGKTKTLLSQEECAKFRKLKSQYVANRIFEEYGYEKAVEYSKRQGIEFEVNPCEGAGAQCSFYCPAYNQCEVRNEDM